MICIFETVDSFVLRDNTVTIYIDMLVIKYVITECYREEDRFLETPRVPKVFQEDEILYGNV